LGLNEDVVSDCFAGTASRIGGITYSGIADNALELHARAFPTPVGTELVEEGVFRYRKGLEYHALNPDVFKALHQAVRTGEKDRFGAYVNLVESRPPTHVRDLLDFAATEPISIDDVEPTETIVKRFMTGAMSFGAISLEAHTTMAIAMNRLGAKSNSGEGGEDPERFHRLPNGDMPSSAVKQVASARFGVTPEYLASAKELEIKMAQGSKPGEGGQLPGHKVTEEIARTRHSVPGVTLISPPPHHDIYSIEDLAQLIYDLKHANPRAKVGVKLVSEAGIGTIAAGVAKAYADVIHISGMEGGTGASPWSSIKNAGLPWELGLAEAQQVLMMNGLRGRVLLRVDGGLKTGRDVIIAALLGAEEYGFGTVSLIAAGCVMARQCHLNSCPVGVASQRKDLRDRFPGKPEHVVSLMLAVADQVRGILASLGARSMKEIIGRVDLLVARKVTTHHNWEHLDLRQILAIADPTWQAPRVSLRGRNNKGDTSLDDLILLDARDVIRGREHRISLSYEIRNTNRAVGAMVAGEIAYEHGDRGIPSGSIECRFTGTAGQSFGAFCIEGLRLVLTGQANDGVGKGMHGGEIAIAPPAGASFVAGDNVLIGNTALYGATGGALYAAGQAGERFAVRNSGATTVVEGVGDHGCEYMTGGTVVILGHTGRNFAAGMTGGVAYVYDPDDRLRDLYNPQLVDLFRLSEENSAKIVRRLIEKHTGETGSERGSYILEKWDAQIGHFWVVQPHEATPIPEAEKARGGKVRHLPVVERVEGEHVDAKVGQPSHATVA
jgi:glutamate synthase domain-containing protein 2/glutamate synthase domain-containing protein 3